MNGGYIDIGISPKKAVLVDLYPQGWVPVSGMKVWSLVVLSNSLHCWTAQYATHMLLSHVLSCCAAGTQMGVPIWDAMHSNLVDRRALVSGAVVQAPSMAWWHAKESGAPLRWSWAGWIPAAHRIIGRLSTSIGCRHPVTNGKASLMAGSIMRKVLQHQAGVQYSAVD